MFLNGLWLFKADPIYFNHFLPDVVFQSDFRFGDTGFLDGLRLFVRLAKVEYSVSEIAAANWK